MIYVASSWRNMIQPAVVTALKAAGHEVYDFRHPEPGNDGFHWSEVGMASYDRETNSAVPVDEYIAGISHPIAKKGYANDMGAMKKCDTCLLVLPCGRSAHLELGWFVGQGRRTAVLLDDPVTPELMYSMVDELIPSFYDLLGWAGVQTELGYTSWKGAR